MSGSPPSVISAVAFCTCAAVACTSVQGRQQCSNAADLVGEPVVAGVCTSAWSSSTRAMFEQACADRRSTKRVMHNTMSATLRDSRYARGVKGAHNLHSWLLATAHLSFFRRQVALLITTLADVQVVDPLDTLSVHNSAALAICFLELFSLPVEAGRHGGRGEKQGLCFAQGWRGVLIAKTAREENGSGVLSALLL